MSATFDQHALDDDESYISPAEQRKIDLLKGLTDAQRESVEHRGSPLVILAGAGTGKTTALTRRTAHIIASGDAAPSEILAVTFTNKAARELQTRMKKLLDDDLDGLTVGTFHAICARMLRDHHDKFGVAQDYVILDADDQKRLIKRIAKTLVDKDMVSDVAEEALDLIENVRGNPAERRQLVEAADPVLREIYQRYEQAKKDDGVLDFTDLIAIIVDGFSEGHVDPAEVAGHYKHILVDEYQDTNGLQFAWLKHMVGDNPNLAVVGDDDQVLYSWRGARIENILQFSSHFPNTKVIKLEQNFRSHGNILHTANEMIAHNRKRLGKTLYTDAEKGRKVHVRYFINAEAEARWVVDEIKALIERGDAPTSIAVLARASRALNIIENKLTFAGIPYVLSGGKRFQDKLEIRDAMAYLKLATNPNDTSSFERIVNTPKRGLGDVAIRRIIEGSDASRQHKAGLSLLDVARNFSIGNNLRGDVPANLRRFLDVMNQAYAQFWRGATAGELLQHLLDESGYIDDLKQQAAEAKSNNEHANLERIQPRIDGLADLVSLAKDMTPIQLVEHLGLAEDGRSRKATGVWVGTIHAAKGLEWPTVIGVGWEDNIMPTWQALERKREDEGAMLDEERRCAYVLITRAMRSLTLTYTGERFNNPAIPSRFIDELPGASTEQFSMQPYDSY
mgnify:CR=1 FL=1